MNTAVAAGVVVSSVAVVATAYGVSEYVRRPLTIKQSRDRGYPEKKDNEDNYGENSLGEEYKDYLAGAADGVNDSWWDRKQEWFFSLEGGDTPKETGLGFKTLYGEKESKKDNKGELKSFCKAEYAKTVSETEKKEVFKYCSDGYEVPK
ncbi:hypothetical protein [Candidatus Mycoplasma haematohominis]|uniref:Uncharacterized protein n=1 Tax=Candidatus Mycoplasma haematohominis TaxID=1494318 RepID=A0A478FTS7_9MOLU|nr:hypothetical protein [Candidatus Mycoplasma haemohominis]GCE63495.1 hypothetical protein MHSWG343_04920 [Candidatus Mycoplasma haemohominis]